MTIFVLLGIAVAAGCIVFLLGRAYPTPIIGEAPAQAVGERLGREAIRHRRLGRLLRGRLDPTTATGLALTVALAGAIVGGFLIGMLAYLMRTNAELLRVDQSVGQWELDHGTSSSTHALQLVTDLGGTYAVVVTMAVVVIVEYFRAPSRWVPVFLLTVIVGESVLVAIIKQALDRARPVFNPAAASLGPSFPSGHSATAASLYAAVALVIARRRTPQVRSFIAACAAAVAVAVACSRVLLGVHWLSDVVAGLALGWAWFAICAIAFGGRLLTFAAPIEKAKIVVECGSRATNGESCTGQVSTPVHDEAAHVTAGERSFPPRS